MVTPHQYGELRLPPRDGRLWVWVIYDHPRDHPDLFVVRPQTYRRDALPGFVPEVWPDTWGFTTLDRARSFCEQYGLVRMARFADDDPVIVEVWL